MPALRIRTDIAPEELRRLACREDDARVGTASAGIGQCARGMPRARAARAAGMDSQTLGDWLIRYNRGGVAALVDACGHGRPCRLSVKASRRR